VRYQGRRLRAGGSTATDPAAGTALATSPGVGVEIDYEENSSPNLTGLQAFIGAYRSQHPYDPTGNDKTARLTIDVATGDRWLIALELRPLRGHAPRPYP
jgi:hypothetical protein